MDGKRPCASEALKIGLRGAVSSSLSSLSRRGCILSRSGALDIFSCISFFLMFSSLTVILDSQCLNFFLGRIGMFVVSSLVKTLLKI